MTTLRLGSRTDGGPATYAFRTRDGLHSDDAFRPADLLVLERCWDVALGDLLVVQANYGTAGVVLADRADSVTMTETSARAADCCRANARSNDVSAAVDVENASSPAALDLRFDTAVYAPRPYTPVAVGKQFVADSLERLRPDGTLFLAGSVQTGLTRYRDSLAALGGDPETVASHDDVELVRAARPVDLRPPTDVEPRTHRTTVDGTDLRLVAEPGLFSSGRLDDGTRLLLETVDVADGDRVLDLCCGYGPVGAYAASNADCDVVLTDDDARATRCAERTLSANGVEGEVVTADCLAGVRGRRFDRILSNPPTHAGSGVLRGLFDGAADVLAPDGNLTVVHHAGLDLSEHLDAFESVDEVATGDEHVVRVAEP